MSICIKNACKKCEYKDRCPGSDARQQTNEEWFNTLTTKGKAEVIAQLSSYGGNVEAILEWLRHPHNRKDDEE